VRILSLSAKGEAHYGRIEREALKQIEKATRNIPEDDRLEFASLFERYANEGIQGQETALGEKTVRRLGTNEDLAQARALIVSERFHKNLLSDIPPCIAQESSLVFGLFSRSILSAVIDCEFIEAKRQIEVLHAIDAGLSAGIAAEFLHLIFREMTAVTGARTLIARRGRVSPVLWKALEGEADMPEIIRELKPTLSLNPCK